MFLTDAVLMQDLADTLQAGGTNNVPAWWNSIVTSCHVKAYSRIVADLAGRGLTPAQIAAWDRGAEFERDLTLYYALSRGGALQNLDKKFIDSFNREAELKDVIYTTGGAYQDPQGTAGQVHVGPQDTSADTFVEDWDNPRLGEETHW